MGFPSGPSGGVPDRVSAFEVGPWELLLPLFHSTAMKMPNFAARRARPSMLAAS